MYRPPMPAIAPLSEDMIERVVETRTNSMDKEFMDGTMKKDAYDANCAALATWAEREYARAKEAH